MSAPVSGVGPGSVDQRCARIRPDRAVEAHDLGRGGVVRPLDLDSDVRLQEDVERAFQLDGVHAGQRGDRCLAEPAQVTEVHGLRAVVDRIGQAVAAVGAPQQLELETAEAPLRHPRRRSPAAPSSAARPGR